MFLILKKINTFFKPQIKNKIRKSLLLLYKIIIFTAFMMIISLLFVSNKNEYKYNNMYNLDYIASSAEIEYHDNIQKISLPYKVKTANPFNIYIDVGKYINRTHQNIAMFTRFLEFECYIDGNKIYEYKVSDNSIPRSGGRVYHVINLPDNFKDENVLIKFKPKTDQIKSFKINKIYITNSEYFFIGVLLSKDILGVILVATLIIVSIMIVMFYFMDRGSGFRNKRIFDIGILCLIIAIYYATQLEIFNYLFRKYYKAIYFLDFLSFSHYSIPMLILVRGRLDRRFDKFLTASIYMCIFNFSIQFILTLLGISEFHNMVKYTHIVLFISYFVILMALIFSSSKDYPEKMSMLLSSVPIFLSLASSLFEYWTGNYDSLSPILLISLFVFVIIQVYFAINAFMYMQKESLNTRTYERLMLTDALTKLGNRYSFEQKLEEIKKGKYDVTIISSDLNDLKEINDTYGHSYGDAAIISAARYLKENFAKDSIYRLGGDEFVIISYNDIDDEYLEEIKNKEYFVKGINKQIKISFAFGKSIYKHNSNYELDDVLEDADKNMYIDKKNIKNAKKNT